MFDFENKRNDIEATRIHDTTGNRYVILTTSNHNQQPHRGWIVTIQFNHLLPPWPNGTESIHIQGLHEHSFKCFAYLRYIMLKLNANQQFQSRQNWLGRILVMRTWSDWLNKARDLIRISWASTLRIKRRIVTSQDNKNTLQSQAQCV